MPDNGNQLGGWVLLAIWGIEVALLAACAPTTNFQGADPNAPRRTWNFDQDVVGGLPAEATAFTGAWAVRPESDAPSRPNALCQSGTAEFPALSLGRAAYGDLKLSTSFKPISGREDQAAGLLVRIQDANNYYTLRANALEGNVNLYKYVGGRRLGLKEGTAKVENGRWQQLAVEVSGTHFGGFLNGQLVVEADDDTFKAGRAGLWTKADSVTCFDDVSVEPR